MNGELTYGEPWSPSVQDEAGNTLTEKTDYTVTQNETNGDNAGSVVTVTVTGIGEYDGLTAEQKYTIVPRPLGALTFDGDTLMVEYNGTNDNDDYLANVGCLRPVNLLEGHTLSVRPSVQNNGTITAPGKYTITAGVEDVKIVDGASNDVTSNYTFNVDALTEASLTVMLSVNVNVKVTQDEFPYDGEEHAAEFEVEVEVPGDTTNKISWEPYVAKESEKVTDVALEAVEVEWEPVFKYDDGEAISPDYITGNDSATAQLKILPRELTITVTPVAAENLTYNGQAQTLVSVSAQLDGQEIPDTISQMVDDIVGAVKLKDATEEDKAKYTQTDADTYTVTLTKYDFTSAPEGVDMGNFAITYKLSDDWQDTTVTIKPRAITVNIEQIVPEPDLVYNGAEQELKLFTATVAEELGELEYNAQEQVRLKEGKGVSEKDAGTYAIKFSADDFENQDSNYTVTFNVPTTAEDVVIQKKKITVVAASDGKEYDGYPLKNNGFAVVDGHYDDIETIEAELGELEYQEGFIDIPEVDGERISAKVTSDDLSTPGSVANTIDDVYVDDGKEANYDIKCLEGTLTIRQLSGDERFAITLVVDSSEEGIIYDGNAHTVAGLESATLAFENQSSTGSLSTKPGENLVTFEVGGGDNQFILELEYPDIECTETDAGVYPVGENVSGIVVRQNGQDVTLNYKIDVKSGTLTIAKRPIVVVAASDIWEFDGGKMTNAGYAVLDNRRAEDVTDDEIEALTYTTDSKTLTGGTELTATVEGGVRFVGEATNIVTQIVLDGEEEEKFSNENGLTEVESENFEITILNGTLEITDRTTPFEINLKGKSNSEEDAFTYNGQLHSLQGLATAEMAGSSGTKIVYNPDDETSGTVSFTYTTRSKEEVTFNLTFVNVELAATEANDDLTIPYTLGDEEIRELKLAMEVTMFADGDTEGTDITGQFDINLVSGELYIQPRPVNVQVTGKKDFGLVDPEFDEYGLTVEFLSLEGEEEESGLVEGDELEIGMFQRVNKDEQPGDYEITPTEDNVYLSAKADDPIRQDNYLLYFVPAQTDVDDTKKGSWFTITDEITWDVELGEIHSHKEATTITIEPPADGQLLPLDTFFANVTVEVSVDSTGVDGEVQNWVGTLPPLTVDTDKFAPGTAAGTYVYTLEIPQLDYVPGNGIPSWKSYLPAGTEVTVTVYIGADAGADSGKNAPFGDAKQTVASVGPVTFTVDYKAGPGMQRYTQGEASYVLDEGGTIRVQTDSQYVGDDDVIQITAGGQTLYFTYKVASGGISLSQLQGLGGNAGWYGTNPTAQLNFTVTLLDVWDHTVDSVSGSVAFDTGAENTTQTVPNRNDSATIELTIADNVGGEPTATGTFGGSVLNLQASTEKGDTITWTNATAWKNTPSLLPHSGDVITVTYQDCVGHTVTHTITVERSPASSGLSINVRPMERETVPNRTLTFFGDATSWEKMTLSFGGRSFALAALPGNAVYDGATRQWAYEVNFEDIDFPVGVPTTISIAYDDLSGGEASIVVTYKDHVDRPALGSELVDGSDAIWGFVEQGTTDVRIDIIRANGEREGVALVALDAGYFCSETLDLPLAEGDEVRITVEDFCGNTQTTTYRVARELASGAVAEVLGASFTGMLDTGAMAHRFATPIDLAALAARANGSMTLPILAYKGIEIGTMTVALTPEGNLDFSYEITFPDALAENARACMSVYWQKPEFDALLNAHSVVATNLNAAPTGLLDSLNVSSYRTEMGYEGVVWVCAQFDIDMDEETYAVKGGRGVNFYRWLSEGRQTMELIGRVYDESSSYAKNKEYYDLYRSFVYLAANS